jgi:hypothetical protein
MDRRHEILDRAAQKFDRDAQNTTPGGPNV